MDDRPCSSSRTCTGPTTPRSTCCATSAAGVHADRVVVLTYRDDEVARATRCGACSAGSPAQPVRRFALQPLAARAVARAGRRPASTPAGSPRSPAATRSSSPRCWPAARRRAGHGRRRGAGPGPPAARHDPGALEQLAVVPSRCRCCWPRPCVGDVALARGGRARRHPRGARRRLAFRHELARRAVAAQRPGDRQVGCCTRTCSRRCSQQERPGPVPGRAPRGGGGRRRHGAQARAGGGPAGRRGPGRTGRPLAHSSRRPALRRCCAGGPRRLARRLRLGAVRRPALGRLNAVAGRR